MTNSTHFRRIRALVTAARALMTDDERSYVREHRDADRKRTIFFIIALLSERFCDEINSLRARTREQYDPVLSARIDLLSDALKALTQRDVGAVLLLLTTKREWLFMLDDPSEPKEMRSDIAIPLGNDMSSANDIMSAARCQLFARGDAFFMTSNRDYVTETREVLIVRTLPFGEWDIDPQTRALEAADREVELAERFLDEVRSRCDAEPGERMSRSVAEDFRAFAVRVFDAHVTRRLVELKRLDLASAYGRGEIAINPFDERGPVEIAEALAAEAVAA